MFHIYGIMKAEKSIDMLRKCLKSTVSDALPEYGLRSHFYRIEKNI